jgi:hypothetical protein
VARLIPHTARASQKLDVRMDRAHKWERDAARAQPRAATRSSHARSSSRTRPLRLHEVQEG